MYLLDGSGTGTGTLRLVIWNMIINRILFVTMTVNNHY